MTRQFSLLLPSFLLVYPSYPVANWFRPPTPAANCRSTLEANPASKLAVPFSPQIGSENPGNDMNEFLEYLASFSMQVLPRPMSLGSVNASLRPSPAFRTRASASAPAVSCPLLGCRLGAAVSRQPS